MRLLSPSDTSRCVPLHVGSGPSPTGPRLGGMPPVGIAPPKLLPGTRYFATIPLASTPPLEASIFLSFDFDQMAATASTIGASDLVSVVVHPPAERVAISDLASELSAHPLVLEPEQSDTIIDDEGNPMINSRHKLGGRPYTFRDRFEHIRGSGELATGGFMQVLQIDFPASTRDAAVEGTWPFADGMFHLFAREPFQHGDWRWLWEF